MIIDPKAAHRLQNIESNNPHKMWDNLLRTLSCLRNQGDHSDANNLMELYQYYGYPVFNNSAQHQPKQNETTISFPRKIMTRSLA